MKKFTKIFICSSLTLLIMPAISNGKGLNKLSGFHSNLSTGKSKTETGFSASPPCLISTVAIIGMRNVTCDGGANGGAIAAASGGTSPYTYSWSDGGTTA